LKNRKNQRFLGPRKQVSFLGVIGVQKEKKLKMVSFIVYDLAFLVLFSIVAIFFFHKYRSSWKRHGWIFLYHSKFGLRFIDWTAKKFSGILKPLQYVIIASGYILTAGILWMLSFSAWRYITAPIPDQLANVPPIAPLIPYFPKLFGLESIFPPLYFTYFIVALAIVAISHEFAHGIIARLNNIKVKTTGLAFFGPFFGAFVEPDEKKMYSSKKFTQLSILAAGTFANVIMTVIFALILWWFFVASFVPAGVNFAGYPNVVVGLDDIDSVGNVFVDSVGENLQEITVVGSERVFLVTEESLERANEAEAEAIRVFQDTPAFRNRLRSPILSIDGVTVTNRDALIAELVKHSPGDTIEIVSLGEDLVPVRKSIELSSKDDGTAFLGIGFNSIESEGFRGLLASIITSIKDPFIYYEPSWDGEFVQFIFDLLWWIVVINILVALFNMLPVSILDGGRFFYLTIWGITGSEKFGKRAYSFATWFILFILLAMMVRWVFVFF
jgi:membrane-associated protease RseP (regulator of RpoE activity)